MRVWDKTRQDPVVVDGAAGGVVDGARPKCSFGKRINDPWIFIPLLLLFVAGLFDWRRPLSLRNLDLLLLASVRRLALLLQRRAVFWSVPLQYPPLIYLFGRMLAARLRPGAGRRLHDALADLAGGRAGGVRARLPRRPQLLGVERHRRRLRQRGRRRPAAVDGSIPVRPHAEGAPARPAARSTPTAPTPPTSRPAAPASRRRAAATRTARSCTTRTCRRRPRSAGPAAGTTCRRRTGRRRVRRPGRGGAGARRLAASAADAWPSRLLFCWATFPFTVYAMSSNTNDAISRRSWPGRSRCSRCPRLRGLMLGLGTWAKFSPVLLVPLWLRADRAAREEPVEWAYTRARVRRSCRARPASARAATACGPGPTRPKVLLGLGAALVLSFVPLMLIDGPSDARHLLGPHLRLAARPALAVLDLGLGRVPGLPRPGAPSRRC